jgi:glutathione reductase (NADPH)
MNVDLIIVGTGEAARSVAFPCREAGWSVAVVDSDPFGGTCDLRGCDPKKVLVGVSELIDWSRRMQGKGVSAPAPALAWADMIGFKRTFTDHVPASIENSFTEAGIGAVHGRAHFTGPTSLRVGDETLAGRHVVIAAGARHAPLGIPGEEYLTTSTGFLELDELPRRVAFVGGGYIAFEFAHIAARGGELVVHARTGDEILEVSADLVVHAAGQVPEIDDLAVEAAGIARADNGGVAVNEYLQSVSNDAVYAAGDAVASGCLPLTPVAVMHPGCSWITFVTWQHEFRRHDTSWAGAVGALGSFPGYLATRRMRWTSVMDPIGIEQLGTTHPLARHLGDFLTDLKTPTRPVTRIGTRS